MNYKRGSILTCVLLVLAGACAGADGEDGGMRAERSYEAPIPAQAAQQPVASVDGRESRMFEDIDSMVTESDLVILGTVESVVDGRTLGSDAEVPVGVRELSIRIDEVLAGNAESGTTVAVEETAFVNGKAVSLNGSKWGNVGDRAVMFLVQKQGETAADGEAAAYRLVTTQGRFFVTDNSGLESNYLADPAVDKDGDEAHSQGPEGHQHGAEGVSPGRKFAEKVAGSMSLDELRAEIRS